MDNDEFYTLKEQVSNHKILIEQQQILIEQQLEKIEIKISHLEEKISDVKTDISDIKTILKELEDLKINVLTIIEKNKSVEYLIDKKIGDFKKELDDKKYKDWRLWISIIGAVIAVFSLVISWLKG